jgi:hypothetical protein
MWRLSSLTHAPTTAAQPLACSHTKIEHVAAYREWLVKTPTNVRSMDGARFDKPRSVPTVKLKMAAIRYARCASQALVSSDRNFLVERLQVAVVGRPVGERPRSKCEIAISQKHCL